MKFISVIGPKDQLDTVTRQYLCRYEIQLENAMGELKHLNNITPNAELNPYREAAGRAAEIAALYGSKATAVRDMDVDTAMERITEVQNRIQKADRKTDALEKELKKERGLLDAVSPYQELHFDISRILHFKEVRFRFGRLPVGYYERLKTYAYDDACTIFEKCKETEDYVWGVYFVPAAEAKKVDAIYASLHFERIHLEDAYEGTVDEACRELKEKTDALEQQITAVRAELAKELNGMSESISAASKTLAYESKLFDVRKLAAFTKAKNETFFILCGWMENKEADLLKKELEEDPDIFCTLEENPDIALVYTTHNETGTGILNPIREIGALAHEFGAVFIVDTTSTLAMRPIDVQKDNIDFCMASAQKGLMAMTGLSFIIGRKDIIEASKDYPKRSYYCNLYLQYHFFEKTGEMHFTPPVQTIYATIQALKEYFAEGEEAKWARHTRVFNAIHKGLDELGFKDAVKREWQAGLVVSPIYPDDPNWDFEKVHDYCYERGYTIYPGKISTTNTFRLCALGAIDEDDITAFFKVFRKTDTGVFLKNTRKIAFGNLKMLCRAGKI